MIQSITQENAMVTFRSKPQRPLKFGSVLLGTFVGIVAIINLAIVVLIAIEVSFIFSIALFVFDLWLLLAMFCLERRSLVIASIVMGILLALALAIWFRQLTAPTQPLHDVPGEVVLTPSGTWPHPFSDGF